MSEINSELQLGILEVNKLMKLDVVNTLITTYNLKLDFQSMTFWDSGITSMEKETSKDSVLLDINNSEKGIQF